MSEQDDNNNASTDGWPRNRKVAFKADLHSATPMNNLEHGSSSSGIHSGKPGRNKFLNFYLHA